jgi:hypothetical protein
VQKAIAHVSNAGAALLGRVQKAAARVDKPKLDADEAIKKLAKGK